MLRVMGYKLYEMLGRGSHCMNHCLLCIRWHWHCVDELLQSADDKLFEKIIHKVSAHVLQPLIQAIVLCEI